MQILSILSLLLFLSSVSAINAPIGVCADVGVISARNDGEPQGAGALGRLVINIINHTPQTITNTSVIYPATNFNDTLYPQSVRAGVNNLIDQIMSAVNSCPKIKLVLLGYGQGAQVVGDALAKGGDINKTNPITAAIPPTIASHVIAAVLFNDPRRNRAIDPQILIGTCDQNGIYPRPLNISLTNFTDEVVSYCEKGDPICCSGTDLTIHFHYVRDYGQDALDFIFTKIDANVPPVAYSSIAPVKPTAKSNVTPPKST